MAPALVSVEEYLRTNSKPNCDYLDGVLRQKAWANWNHGGVQARVGSLIMQDCPGVCCWY